MRRGLSLVASLVTVVAISACGDDTSTSTTPSTAPTTSAAPSTTAQTAPAPETTPTRPEPDDVEGTIVRFSHHDVEIDVTIRSDNPTSREFLSMLPTTLTIEEFSGREKISYLPDRLTTEGSPGSDPEDGDLIYFAPWGNLGFYYNADGIDYSDDTVNLGTYDATREQLARLEGDDVTVRRVSP